jgi:methylglutaconyl-CoA hydratase
MLRERHFLKPFFDKQYQYQEKYCSIWRKTILPGEAILNRSVELNFIPTASSELSTVAVLAIAREKSANSFNADLILGIQDALRAVSKEKTARALLLCGKGKFFSAGADLNWMKDSAVLSYEENLRDSHHLSNMFEALYHFPIPTIAVIHGAAYGGAVGLAACCDIVVAEKETAFCLSEIKLGILPAVIYPYLAKRIQLGQLRRLSLTARKFSAAEALNCGLVDRIYARDTRSLVVVEELNGILSGGPEAGKRLKALHRELELTGFIQRDITSQAISEARTGLEGQAGLQCFFAKEPPPWSTSLKDGWDYI